MCGILGIKANFINNRNIKKALDKMIIFLSHRGPDNKEICISNNLYLGHLRLKIIDLSDNANQPMTNEKNNIFMVAIARYIILKIYVMN